MIQGERTLAGRYEIGHRIGRGGMADVYEATDTRLGRRVAVKLLNTNLASESDFRLRFRQEAQAAARMTHPTIVRVFDAGEDTFVSVHGREVVVPYIVMEFIDGRQLRDAIDEGPLPFPRIQEYMDGLLTSLEYSHRAGVVHRDIKPGNVMITKDGRVKVTDFGIARAISDTAGTIAQTTAILGTASYFSPEQARGEQVDGRSDVYSAGVVLYEMLTGEVPFTGDSAVAVAYRHVTEAPRKPSEINPQVTPALDAVVLRALAKRREDRYQTAADFREDLDGAFAGRMPAHTAVMTEENPTELFGPGPTAVDATESALNSIDTHDDRAPQVQRRPPAMWIWASTAIVAAVIVGVLIWVAFGLPKNPVPDASVLVPDVVGTQYDEANATLTEKNLTVDKQTATSDTVPANVVMSMTPPAGAQVAPGQTVTLTVSTGPSAVGVPNLQGLTVDQAQAALEKAGLTLGTITTKDSPSMKIDLVISSSPQIGQPAAPGSAVDLFVSSGKVTLPDLRGQSLDEAYAVAGGLGLMLVVREDATCPAVDEKTITQMDVAPGKVDQGSQVGVTYCSGAQPQPTPGNSILPTPTQG